MILICKNTKNSTLTITGHGDNSTQSCKLVSTLNNFLSYFLGDLAIYDSKRGWTRFGYNDTTKVAIDKLFDYYKLLATQYNDIRVEEVEKHGKINQTKNSSSKI